MRSGALCPETFAAMLHTQSASLPRNDKSLALASALEILWMAAVAWQMGRFSGPLGGDARQDVPAATDVGEESKDASLNGDIEAR